MTAQEDMLVSAAAMELEKLRKSEQTTNPTTRTNNHQIIKHKHKRFPLSCLKLLQSIPGNLRCIDCGAGNPQWATITYGSLMCIECSGRHRSMGVQVSKVRSITMDSWNHSEILTMLEGGNKQLSDFFQRHKLSSQYQDEDDEYDDDISTMDRYKTNAAKFYKKNLSLHVMNVRDMGLYKGRNSYRQRAQKKASFETRRRNSIKNIQQSYSLRNTSSEQ